MRRVISVLLVLFLLCPMLVSCKKEEEKEINNILFLGDDLMETSEIYNYFYELCKANEKDDVTVDYECIEDARMYTFVQLCESDSSFAERVANADLIVFEEGTAETATTAESVSKLREYGNNPIMVCLCIYGYPCWMYREDFEEKKLENIKYADSDYFIKKIIAADDTPIGYEHLCLEDYIHPNHLNGFLASMVTFCEVFHTMPQYINLSPFDNDIRLAESADVEVAELPSLLYKLACMMNDEMK